MDKVQGFVAISEAPGWVFVDAPGRQSVTLAMRVHHRLARWPVALTPLRNRAPLVSFTFDDVPDSAADLGATILEDAGARGTFFVSTGLLGVRSAHWLHADAGALMGLASRGHEVSLHTHAHRPLAEMGRRAFAADLLRCKADLRGRFDCGLRDNFAYPFGFAHALHRATLRRTVRSSRTTHPGLNSGRVDLHYLKSWAFGSSLADPAAVDRLLDDAMARGGWLIFTGHDIRAEPSPYGCTPDLLAHAVRGAARRGIAVEPLDRALDLCGVPPLSTGVAA